MRRDSLLMMIGLGCATCLTGAAAGKLHFETNGFSIAPLEGNPKGESYQAVMMFLPASGGFAPNVDVQIQRYTGTFEEYLNLSKQQMVQAKLKLIKESQPDKKTFLMEYAGTLQSASLHWYAKAVLVESRVYLVTATAAEDQWASVSTQLKACVDSFELDDRP